MNSSEHNGKVDVAMRIRRAWSAPAAPLRHIRSRCAPPAEAGVGGGGGDALAIPAALYRLFPTQTAFAIADVVYAAADGVAGGAAEVRPAPMTSSEAASSHDALAAELQAAKHQIALLTAASSQSFERYTSLEAENAQLRGSNAQLTEDNESLRERLARREDEIGEQLHLICDLEKRLEEFSSLSVTNKANWNGRNGD